MNIYIVFKNEQSYDYDHEGNGIKTIDKSYHSSIESAESMIEKYLRIDLELYMESVSIPVEKRAGINHHNIVTFYDTDSEHGRVVEKSYDYREEILHP